MVEEHGLCGDILLYDVIEGKVEKYCKSDVMNLHYDFESSVLANDKIHL